MRNILIQENSQGFVHLAGGPALLYMAFGSFAATSVVIVFDSMSVFLL